MPGSVSQRRRPVVYWALLLVILAIQVRLLYAPDVSGPVLFAGADKLVHAGLFGLPSVIMLFGRLRPRVVLPLLALHAPVSEVVQGMLLESRIGDPWDAAADLLGMAVAVGLWWVVAGPNETVEGAGALVD